jgi:hypothetical protein
MFSNVDVKITANDDSGDLHNNNNNNNNNRNSSNTVGKFQERTQTMLPHMDKEQVNLEQRTDCDAVV